MGAQAGSVRQAEPGAGFREPEVGREALVDRLVAAKTAEALAKAESVAAAAAAEAGPKDGFALRQEVLKGAEVICAQVCLRLPVRVKARDLISWQYDNARICQFPRTQPPLLMRRELVLREFASSCHCSSSAPAASSWRLWGPSPRS